MLTLLIVFLSAVLVGLGFWFYNRKQVKNLVESIDDKQAIIHALTSHVENVESTDDLNKEWKGESNHPKKDISNPDQKKSNKQKRYYNTKKKSNNGENKPSPKKNGGKKNKTIE